MKKILGVLGVAMIVAVMFFSTNNVNGASSDTSLASLLTLNSANAECVDDTMPSLIKTRCLPISEVCVPITDDPTGEEYGFGCRWPW